MRGRLTFFFFVVFCSFLIFDPFGGSLADNGTGASEINISCVVEAREATRAMNVLHTNLFTFLD